MGSPPLGCRVTPGSTTGAPAPAETRRNSRASVESSTTASTAAKWFPMHWWGPPPHHFSFANRAPDGVLVAAPDQLLLHRFSDDRLVGNHGGLTDAERRVPLLVAE